MSMSNKITILFKMMLSELDWDPRWTKSYIRAKFMLNKDEEFSHPLDSDDEGKGLLAIGERELADVVLIREVVADKSTEMESANEEDFDGEGAAAEKLDVGVAEESMKDKSATPEQTKGKRKK